MKKHAMRYRRPRLRLMAATLTACATLGAWIGLAGGGAASPAVAAAKPSIALFVAIEANPYEAVLIKGAQTEAAKLGASIQVFDPKDVPATQVTQCQDALATKKYNVFVIKAVAGATMEPCAKTAISQGIKVVAADDPLGPNYSLAPQVPGIVGSVLSLPQTSYGTMLKLTARACANLNPCNVAFFYGPAAFSYSSYGSKYYLAHVKQYPKIHVIDTATWNFDIPTAETLARTVLVAHPDVNLIVCDGDQGSVGIVGVLQKAGKLGKIKIVSGGGSIQGAAAIKAGQIVGTAPLYPGSIGRLSVKLGVEALQGTKIAKTAFNAAFLESVGPLVDKSNVSKFHPQWSD
jgi:ABC-type sugar transport system substrate-binding protein